MRMSIILTILAPCAAGAMLCGCAAPAKPVSTEEAIAHYVQSQRTNDDLRALVELNKAVEADPNLSMAHVAIGDIQRRHGNYDLARRAYESACRINPYYFRPHYNLGVTYQLIAEQAQAGAKYEEALRSACDIYLRAVALDPNDYDANLNLSACYFQLGAYVQAQKYCQEAIRINPKKPEAYSNLGVIYDSRNMLYESIAAYKQALELDVHQAGLLMNLGSTYMRQNRLEYAIGSFQQAAKEDPKSSTPYEQMGTCYYRKGELAAALEMFRKAAAINKKSSDALRGVGVVYMTQFLGDPVQTQLRDNALEAWNNSLENNPDQADLRALVEKYTPRTTQPAL